jgi:hypothetical protein
LSVLESAVLRLTLLRAEHATKKGTGTITLYDLKEAHGWALTEIDKRRWKSGELTDEQIAEALIVEHFGKGQSA